SVFRVGGALQKRGDRGAAGGVVVVERARLGVAAARHADAGQVIQHVVSLFGVYQLIKRGIDFPDSHQVTESVHGERLGYARRVNGDDFRATVGIRSCAIVGQS